MYLRGIADINECDDRNGDCQHNCVDTDGSYYCTCRDGFTLEADAYECGGV